MLEELRQLKTGPCSDCGRTFPPYCMDFDHRDGSDKVGAVSELIFMVGKAAWLAEIEKCDLVCANCHRVRTYNRIMAGR